MKNAKDCFGEFEKEKNGGYATETALRVTFSALRLSVETLRLNALTSDRVIYNLVEKMRTEWNKFIKKVHGAGYERIPAGSFERLSKEAQPEHYKVWSQMRKQAKK